ncbi:Hypothetical predicted protein, partial [Paramuricea clavata]
MALGNQQNSAFNEGKSPKQKPPCAFCSKPHHGIWAYRQFEHRLVERWNFAKEKQLCFSQSSPFAGKKIKVNAILDGALANLLGIQEAFQLVQVHVLNNSVETFQSMPEKIEIESVDGVFGKVIEENNSFENHEISSQKIQYDLSLEKNIFFNFNRVSILTRTQSLGSSKTKFIWSGMGKIQICFRSL